MAKLGHREIVRKVKTTDWRVKSPTLGICRFWRNPKEREGNRRVREVREIREVREVREVTVDFP
jgi:hypothetical protein